MKVTAISDLHGNLIDIEPCDLLCICGDISPLNIQKDYEQMTIWVFGEFYDWIKSLPCEKVFFTPGNHDFWFEKFCNKNMQDIFKFNKFEILIDEIRPFFLKNSINEPLQKVMVYGTPWCKTFGKWAFMPGNYCLDNKYSNIPENVDILMCHDSPSTGEVGYIHYDEPLYNGETKIPEGNLWLADAINIAKPKYVFSGHIHSGDHELKEFDGIKYANCSILDESYSIHYKPLTIEIL